jgi:hypothetical protein
MKIDVDFTSVQVKNLFPLTPLPHKKTLLFSIVVSYTNFVHNLWKTCRQGFVMKIEIRGAEKLSFREKQVVVLKETGKSSEEICRTLNLSPSTVATLYNRARAKGYEVVIVLPGEVLGLFKGEEDSEED